MVDINKIKIKLPEGLRIHAVNKLDEKEYLVTAVEEGHDIFDAPDPYYVYDEKTGELSRFDVAANFQQYSQAVQSENLA